MWLFKTIAALQQQISDYKTQKKQIGFVPTMGALHAGHIALVEMALQENEVVVCSIFVNPTQFNDPKDLEKYPRPIEKDIEMLTAAGCTVLFLPAVDEIYPAALPKVELDLEGLDLSMEGAHRPGHFEGVVQVVHRLLDIVQPHSLYMGQKDFQQFTVIKHMIRSLELPIRLVRVPIIREEDGLAMSSRNVRLSPEGRSKAAQLSQTLFLAQEEAKELSLAKVKEQALERLLAQGFVFDYFEIVDAKTLKEVHSFEEAESVVACITVNVDGVRLLDNVILK